MTSASTATQYTVQFKDQQFGPHTREDIESMLSTGMIDESAQLWRDGWPGWIPVSNVIRAQAEAAVAATPAYQSEYSREKWEQRRKKLRRYRDRVGRRSYVFQMILIGWTLLYAGWIIANVMATAAHAASTTLYRSSPSFSPMPQFNALDLSAGMLSGWMCVGTGWGVVGLPVGIAAVATLKED